VLSGPAQPAQRRIQGRQQINILSGTSPQAVQKQVGKMRKYCFYFFVGADENSTMLRKIISGFLQILWNCKLKKNLGVILVFNFL
jgi:hypothetical protein